MDPNTRALIMGAAGAAGGEKLYVEDVFSTWLYTGNGSTQTITNGIDLSGEGGLVWLKNRTGTYDHWLWDTGRGAGYSLNTNNTGAQANIGTSEGVSFGSTGFSFGNNSNWNQSGTTAASWTFRKAPGFFDVVTYTGTGTLRTVAHNLGSVPGCMIIKRLDVADNWTVYHRSTGNAQFLELNSAGAAGADSSRWNGTSPTSSVFTVDVNSAVNASGGTYVAYLFAHDEPIFGDAGDQSVIKCGSYTHGSGVTEVNVGFEPQWLLIKRTDTAQSWYLFDNMRGWTADANRDAQYVSPNTSAAETGIGLGIFANGFRQDASIWGSGGDYIYIAIRRGPMETPTSGTEVFNATAQAGGSFVTTSFPADVAFLKRRPNTESTYAFARLHGAGKQYLLTASSSNESTSASTLVGFDSNLGITDNLWGSASSLVYHCFRRAPGFFDVVAYTGDGTTGRNISHNLGAAPELIILKSRNGSGTNWFVNGPFTTWSLGYPTGFLNLTDQIAGNATTGIKNITSTTFEVNSPNTNTSNSSFNQYIAYLFASCPGVSKVGSYTGTGTTLSIDCGFTSGARFVLIKRTDSTGDWYVWDTARGIVAGNDPYLLLNSTAAEVTSTDYIDPLSSGFQISSTAPAAINASGGSFVYLAIA